MKKHTKAKSTRVVEILLSTFILEFVARATPNSNLIPNIPWADARTNGGLGNTDDKDWGNYARMEWIATKPPSPTRVRTSKIQPEWKSPKKFPVLPGKFWLWHRNFEA
jgi:hypothetical protein